MKVKKTGMVSLVTGKIIGVEPGTREWYHEEGHIEFRETEEGIRHTNKRENLWQWIIVGIMAAILYKPLIFIPGVMYILMIKLDLKEEKWCWKYADRKMEEKKE